MLVSGSVGCRIQGSGLPKNEEPSRTLGGPAKDSMGYILNSLMGVYIGDYIGDYYKVIKGDTRSFRQWLI